MLNTLAGQGRLGVVSEELRLCSHFTFVCEVTWQLQILWQRHTKKRHQPSSKRPVYKGLLGTAK